MKAEPSRWNLRATYTIELKAEDAPPTTSWYGGNAVQPNTVTISYEYPPASDVHPRANVWGRNILKGGGHGVERRLQFFFAPDRWPAWLRALATEHAPNWEEVLAKGVPSS